MRTSEPSFIRNVLAGLAAIAFLAMAADGRAGKPPPPPPPPPPSSSIHTFTGYATDGALPKAGLVKDGSGNFYGTTLTGGNNNYHNTTAGDGAVFKITSSGAESIVWDFGSGQDGWSPQFGDLIIHADGNLYGTTARGGSNDAGTVFEVSPNGSGGWTEAVLWSFGGSGDGAKPYAGLAKDAGGNLFGATTQGGASNLGTVFKLSFNGSGWSETILHSFGGTGDGSSPRGVIVDVSGNIYGTTFEGGANNWGTAFELSPPAVAGDPWSEKVLRNFGAGLDGKMPLGSLNTDGSGVLYGTTMIGGAYMPVGGGACCGTAYKLTPQSNGTWAETILWSFGNPKVKGDGQQPQAGLLVDSAGNLYGTCYTSGASGKGTAFKLVKPLSGSTWTENILWNFASGDDAGGPSSDLVLDSSGKLYGTTYVGGSAGVGTVFKITP